MFVSVGSKIGRRRAQSNSRTIRALGGETMLTVGNIPLVGFSDLKVRLFGRTTNASQSGGVSFILNGSSASVYSYQRMYINEAGGTPGSSWGSLQSSWGAGLAGVAGNTAPTQEMGSFEFTIEDYTNSADFREGFFRCRQPDTTPGHAAYYIEGWLHFTGADPISQVSVIPSGGTTFMPRSSFTVSWS